MSSNEKLSAALAPLQHIFSFPQFEALLYAYLPSKIDKHFLKTGIYSVDTFVCTATVTVVLTAVKVAVVLAALLYAHARSRVHPQPRVDDIVSILVEPIANNDDYRHGKSLYEEHATTDGKLLSLVNAHVNLQCPQHPTYITKVFYTLYPGACSTVEVEVTS